MKKILLCSPLPNIGISSQSNPTGGIAMWTKHILAYNAIIEDITVDLVIFPMGRKFYISPLTRPLNRLAYGINDYLSVIKKFKKSVKREMPNIVHIATSGSFSYLKDILMQRIAKRNNAKNIIHFHLGKIPELFEKKNWEWLLLKYIIRHADAAIVLDMKSYTVLFKAGYKNVKLVPNPLSLELLEIINDNKSEKRINGKIVFAGHLLPSKGVYELIQACIKIPNINLTMVGAPPLGIENKLMELARLKGNDQWIKILGEQNSEVVIKEMLSSSVFVLPSYTEGFPNVILESMACGCSIVASSVGAIPEMLNVESVEAAGLCFLPRNMKTLQNALERMLNDKQFAERCGENASKRVKQEYSINVVWKQLASIWEQL